MFLLCFFQIGFRPCTLRLVIAKLCKSWLLGQNLGTLTILVQSCGNRFLETYSIEAKSIITPSPKHSGNQNPENVHEIDSNFVEDSRCTKISSLSLCAQGK
jgi:hypothetical protein